MSRVYNDHTGDEKTCNGYSDDEHINFNLVRTATNISNLSSLNKNNSNACDITIASGEKAVEVVLAKSVPSSAPDNYNKVNLHLVELSIALVINLKLLSRKQGNLLQIMTLQSIIEHIPVRKNQKIKLKKLTDERKALLDIWWFYSASNTRRQALLERHYQSSIFSRSQICWLLPLRHSAYK